MIDVEDGDAYDDNGTYYYQIEQDEEYGETKISALSQIKVKINDEYEASEFAMYMSQSSKYEKTRIETIYELLLKDSLATLITKPINEKQYIEGSFDLDLDDIL